MKQILFFLFVLFFVSSCGNTEGGKDTTEEMPDDSAQLRIAVMPTLDCLPLFVADEHGFFVHEGVDVSLFPFRAQMDCDTAFQRGRVNGVVSDLVRVESLRQNGFAIHDITSTSLSWQLLSGRQARIRQLKQLDDKMVAMTRFSATHLLADKAVDSAKLQTERVFRIQVNDIKVRYGMLDAGIMDALFMPEPWATKSRNIQAHVLLDTRKMDLRLGVIAFTEKAATQKQISAFTRAYNMACDTINEKGLKSFSKLIAVRCGIEESVVDSIPPIHYDHASQPRPIDKQVAIEWLAKQGREHKDDNTKLGTK